MFFSVFVIVLDFPSDGSYLMQISNKTKQKEFFKINVLYGFLGDALALYFNIYHFCRDGTAIGGNQMDLLNNKCDFEQVHQGELMFMSGEESHEIKININESAEVGTVLRVPFIFCLPLSI